MKRYVGCGLEQRSFCPCGAWGLARVTFGSALGPQAGSAELFLEGHFAWFNLIFYPKLNSCLLIFLLIRL